MNWESAGIVWETSDVSRQHGPNKSDRAVIGTAEIPKVVDMAKAIDAGLGDAMLAGINGTSWRVTAQDVSRRYIEATPKDKRNKDDLRKLVYDRLRGIRARVVGGRVEYVEVVKRPLPDGTMYDGTDEVEFRQLYLAALVDGGVQPDVARTLATNVQF